MQMDEIDRIRHEWSLQSPKLDTSSMDSIGRILRAQFLLSQRLRGVFDQFDLDAGAFDVLATLRRSGPPFELKPTDLYKRLVITSGAMTHRMDTLERAGLIERRHDTDDRRSVTARLTKKGQEAIDHAMEAHMEAERKLADALSRSERVALGKLLKKLLINLEESCN